MSTITSNSIVKRIHFSGSKRHLRIRYIIVVSLFTLFIWWGAKSFLKYWSQPLTTNISYKFGDGIGNGIQFPVITFCQYGSNSNNPLLKNCNNGSWFFLPSFLNCIKNDGNFNIDSFLESLQFERKLVIEKFQLWNGSMRLDLEYLNQHVWSTVFHYSYGLCLSFDLSNVEEYEFVQYNQNSRPGITFTVAENSLWSKYAVLLHSKNDLPDAWLLNGKRTISMSKKTTLEHVFEIQKRITKRESTRSSPCVDYEYNTCRNLEMNQLVLDQFNCQIPVLYFGHHLDYLLQGYI